MALLENAQMSFEAWMNSLSAADSAGLGIIGFGLMIFAVAALLIQRYLEQRDVQRRRDTLRPRSHRPVPGVRHSRMDYTAEKSSVFSMKSKKDPFLARLERLA